MEQSKTAQHSEGASVDMWAKYLKERENVDLLVLEGGFATYRIEPTYVYLVDIYVLPGLRDAGLGVELMHQVEEKAREQGITLMYGSVDTKDKNHLKMLQIMKHLKFEESHKDQSMIYLKRTI